MCKMFEVFENCSSLSFCRHSTVYRVFWPSNRSSTAYILIIFKPSTTGTMHLTTQILRTATKLSAALQIINRNMENFLFLHLLSYSYSSLFDAIKS